MTAEFVFPTTQVQGDGWRLVPFEVEQHAEVAWQASKAQEIWQHITIGPFASKDDFIRDFVHIIPKFGPCQIYAIMTTRPPKGQTAAGSDKVPEVMAGVTAFMSGSPQNLQIEIGGFVLFPPWHGTGLGFAVGDAMVRHALADPTGVDGGLGCRRVHWRANSANLQSQGLAKKLGFRFEGILRWDAVFHNGVARGKIGNGRPLPPWANPGDLGRDTWLSSRCWDD